MSFIRHIAATSGIGYGVNILEKTPPGRVTGRSTNVVGMVGDFPWGPTNEITSISTAADFFSTFCPPEFAATDDYDALKAVLNKTFPGGLKVVRIAASSQAKSSHTFVDGSAGDSIDVTAKYPGVLGDSITVEFSVNADDANAVDMTVTVGDYSQTYEAVATTTGSLSLTDPGDPFVDIALSSGATDVPAAASSALSGGSDGAAVAGDYVGSSSSNVGIRTFYGEAVDVDVLFVAECPASLADAVNTGLEAYGVDTDKGVAVLCSPAGQSLADAKTYLSTNSIADDRSVYCWPRVKTANRYAADNAAVEVDNNSFVAAAIASVDPEVSPGGASGAPFLNGISALADTSASRTDYDELNDAGVAGISISTPLGGAFIRRAVTTDTTSGKEKLFRRRMTDFIVEAIADRAVFFVETPLDLDLSNQELGPNTSAFIGEIDAFLAGLEGAERIQDYSIDAFSGNTSANIAAGRWVIQLAVKLYSMAEEIVLEATIGEGVEINEAA